MPSLTSEPIPQLQAVLWRLNECLLNAGNPSEIEASLAELEGVTQRLRLFDPAPSPEVAAELGALQADLRRAATLVQSGLALQHSWARVLGAAAGGYTADGEAAPLGAPRQLSVQG